MNPKICPVCQASVPEDAPGGLCPACVLRDAGEPRFSGPGAPALEEIAAAFPQLEILSLIGHGGMGFVYKARQPRLDRVVALKILSPELRRDPAFEERFAREARVLGKLRHPNIVTLHEHGESGGFFYLLMEFVDGVNLRQAMSAGRFTPEQALAIVPAICDALQTAHAQGVWHRDIKPENILLDHDGRVKIADFGIARIAGDAEQNFTLTRTGGQLGSAAYMAPEQHEKPHDVDHRADIYSLGVVIYEMLTGELPLGRFPLPSQRAAVDARIDEIVLRTLEKERELRQQSAGEVKTEVQGAGNPRFPVHPAGKSVRRVSRWPWVILATGVALLALFSLTAEPFVVSHFWRSLTNSSYRSSTSLSTESGIGYLQFLRLWFLLGLAFTAVGLAFGLVRGARGVARANKLASRGLASALIRGAHGRETDAGMAGVENHIYPPTVEPASAGRLGVLTISLFLGGVLGPFVLGVFMPERGNLLFALGLIALVLALVTGIVARKETLGKIAWIGSLVVLLIAGPMFLMFRVVEAIKPKPLPVFDELSSPEKVVKFHIKTAEKNDQVGFEINVSTRLIDQIVRQNLDTKPFLQKWPGLSYSHRILETGNRVVVRLVDRKTGSEYNVPVVLLRESHWQIDCLEPIDVTGCTQEEGLRRMNAAAFVFASPLGSATSLIAAARAKDVENFQRGISAELLEMTLEEDSLLAEPMRDWVQMRDPEEVFRDENRAEVRMMKQGLLNTMTFVREGGEWKLAVPGDVGGNVDSPRAAMEQFIKALREDDKEAMKAWCSKSLIAIADDDGPLDNEAFGLLLQGRIVEARRLDGQSAEVTFESNDEGKPKATFRMVREDGAWKLTENVVQHH